MSLPLPASVSVAGSARLRTWLCLLLSVSLLQPPLHGSCRHAYDAPCYVPYDAPYMPYDLMCSMPYVPYDMPPYVPYDMLQARGLPPCDGHILAEMWSPHACLELYASDLWPHQPDFPVRRASNISAHTSLLALSPVDSR